MNTQSIIQELSNLKPSSTFLTIKGYANDKGEIADHSIVFHMSYKNALERSIETISQINPENELEITAKTELLASLNKSLETLSAQPLEERDDGYTRFMGEDGHWIKGVRVHEATGNLHLFGLVVHKRVIIPGTYPAPKNKRPLTVVKDRMKKLTSLGKFRSYVISPEKVESISVSNLSLVPNDKEDVCEEAD